jgi:hypothetical protein
MIANTYRAPAFNTGEKVVNVGPRWFFNRVIVATSFFCLGGFPASLFDLVNPAHRLAFHIQHLRKTNSTIKAPSMNPDNQIKARSVRSLITCTAFHFALAAASVASILQSSRGCEPCPSL